MNTKFAKKFLAAGLALSLALSGAAAVSAKGNGNGKGDDDKGKDKGKIEIKVEANVVSRLEAIVTAVRLMGLRDLAESDAKKKVSLNLKDEKQIPMQSKGYVAVALENGLLFETVDKLQPNKPADRLWVSVMLVKALKLEAEAKAKMNTKLDFKDAKEIPAAAVGYVAVALEKGIIKGYGDKTFKPNKPVTRAEIAVFLDRTGGQIPDFNAVQGKLQAAVANNKLTLDNGTSYTVDPNAFVYKNGAKIALTQLQVGDTLRIRLYNNVVIFIEVLTPAGNETPVVTTVSGTLAAAVSGTTLSVTTNNTTTQYTLASNAVIKRNGAVVASSALLAGDQVTLKISNNQVMEVTSTGSQPVNATFTGMVTATVANNVLSVYDDNRLVQYPLATNVDIYRSNVKVTAAALKAGDEVYVRVDNGLVTFVNVNKRVEDSTSLSGSISAMDATNRTVIIRKDGVDAGYLVDANARIYRDNVKVALSQVKIGDELFVKIDNNLITYVQVVRKVEDIEFTVNGLFQAVTLNSTGKIATVSISQTVNSSTQVSVYNVSSDVTITGNAALMVLNHPVELKGKNQVVTQIIIK